MRIFLFIFILVFMSQATGFIMGYLCAKQNKTKRKQNESIIFI